MRATSPFLFLPYSGICALRWEVAVWYFCAQNQVRTTDNRLHDVCKAIMKIIRDWGRSGNSQGVLTSAASHD